MQVDLFSVVVTGLTCTGRNNVASLTSVCEDGCSFSGDPSILWSLYRIDNLKMQVECRGHAGWHSLMVISQLPSKQHLYPLTRLVQDSACLQGLEAQSSMFISQLRPV